MAIETLNPATGEVVKRFDEYSADQIETKLAQAEKTYRSWKETSFATRAEPMKKMAELLRERERALGEIITLEMGKPIKQSIAEIQKCAWACEYYAENAEGILGKRMLQSDGSQAYLRYDPIGPVLAVMPWNFPFWQVYRFAAPAAMAGNVGVLKHASNVPMAALQMEKLFLEAGFPEGVFTTLLISAKATEGVIRDRRIVAATLTGSDPAGRKVASTAGSVLKKTVLELGGSDPCIVLPDADLDKAAKVAALGRSINTGQSCIAAKRFIVHKDVAEIFAAKFKDALAALKLGDPMREDTDLGPMARADLRDDLHAQVVKSVKQGAKLELGGEMPEGPGYFYPMTMLTGVTPEMTVAIEETFGPAAPVIVAQDEDHAIAIANNSEFGLGGSLWTADIEKAHELVSRIESGCVFVNGLVKSDPRLPFGGIKTSGYGRELSDEGIREFVNAKTVWIG